MKKIKFRKIKPMKLANQGKPLNEDKQAKLYPEMVEEILKYANSGEMKDGVIQVYTNGNYELAMIDFDEREISDAEENLYHEHEITALPGKMINELDSLRKIYWEVIWTENQTLGRFKSYLYTFASDNYAKFRSKHQNN